MLLTRAASRALGSHTLGGLSSDTGAEDSLGAPLPSHTPDGSSSASLANWGALWVDWEREDNSHGCLLPVGCLFKAGMCRGFTLYPAAGASMCNTPRSWEKPSKINLVTPRSARRNRVTPPHSGPLNEWNRGSLP